MIAALAGGVGGAKLAQGLMLALPPGELAVVVNTADDFDLYGLRICPDLDTVMYTLGGAIDETRGWGRAGETFGAKQELAAYGVGPAWFGLGDRDLATHLVRTHLLTAGLPLSAVTAALCERWRPGVTLLPMSDDRVETHVDVREPGGTRRLHFQEYWVRLGARRPVHAVTYVGIADAKPAPGVLDALAAADLVVLPPSNPVVSIGPILAVAGVRDALRTIAAPVVGVSPIVGGAPVRGMADKLLPAIGVETSAAAVAAYYSGDLLDGWLVDERDAASVPRVEAAGIAARAVPLLMRDLAATAAMARATLALADEVRR